MKRPFLSIAIILFFVTLAAAALYYYQAAYPLAKKQDRTYKIL